MKKLEFLWWKPAIRGARHSPGTQCLSLAILGTVAFFILFTSRGFSGTDDRAKAEIHASLGRRFAQQGDLVRAEGELRQAAALAPDDSEILSSLGTVLAMQGKLEESTTIFRKALALSPGDMTVRRYLAANLWQLHRYPEARHNLEILLRENPDDGPARLLLGMVAENMKDYATAAKMLSSVPDQVRQQPESIGALARSYYHLGQTKEAQATLAGLSDTGAQAVLLGAGIADEMRDYETAEHLLLSIQSEYPDRTILGYRLALVQYHEQRFGDSERTLLDLIESGHTSGRMYNLLGWCYHEQNQSKEAVQSLNRAIDTTPEDETNYTDLIEILVADRSIPSALAVARKAAAALPKSARMFELRGSLETRMGQFADAISSYSRAVELDPSRASEMLGLAQAQFSGGRTKEATASLEAASKRFPKDGRFRVLYSSVLLKEAESGDPQAERRAEGMLRSALALDPSLASAHYELGKLELNRGHLPEALQQLEAAVKLDAQSGEAHFALARAYRRAQRKEEAAREMDVYQKLKEAETQTGLPLSEAEKQE
jgi:tetratricopeptide (TPR) repeat protein